MSELTSPVILVFRVPEMTRLTEVSATDWLGEEMFSFSVG